MRIELTSDCLQSILACLGTCFPINETVFHSGFYWWFVPHHLLTCTSEQGPKQCTLSHLCLFVWVATPMKSRFLSSVLIGLLSVSFERVVGLKPTTSCLEGRSSNQLSYTRNSWRTWDIRHIFFTWMERPISLTPWVHFINVNFSPKHVSFYRPKLNKRLNILWTHVLSVSHFHS